jgi:hypothetical protein
VISPNGEPDSKRLAAVGWAALLVLAAVACTRALSFPLNHDVGWWLHISRSMLAGEVLYRDLIEVNPPMTAFLSIIPVLLSQASGLPIPTASILWVLFLVLGVTGWAAMLGKGPGAPAHHRPIIGGAILFGVGFLPGGDFGQREHLMFTLVIPYMLVLWRRASGYDVSLRSSLAAGLFAGVGLALKPHFLLIWLSLEVASWLESGGDSGVTIRRLRSSERLALFAVLGVYGLAVLLQGEYLPLLAMTASTYEDFASANRLQLAIGVPSAALIFGLFVVSRAKTDLARLARYFFAVGCGSMVLTVLQGKGWSYHFYPVLAGLAGIVILMVFDFGLRASKVRERGRLTDGTLLVLMGSLVLLLTALRIEGQARVAAQQSAALEEQVEHLARFQSEGSFLVLSAFVSRSFPLVNYTDLGWASPFPALWWIRARNHRPEQGTPRVTASLAMEDSAEEALTQLLISRFLRSTPVTVLVDMSADAAFAGARFPYVEYLSQNDQFRREWRNYIMRSEVGPFAVWVRRETDGPPPGTGRDDAS